MTWLVLWLMACGASAPETLPTTEVLAAADAHDGAVDKVVGECAGCMLGMSGDPAHAVQHEGYELHFCSSSCKEGFAADPDAGLRRLESVVKPGS